MTREQDYERFVELLEDAAIKTTVPSRKNIGQAVLVYYDRLERYPFEVVKAAVNAYCDSGKFFPALTEIVTRIEGTPEERAAMAWAEVDSVARKIGGDRSVRFRDPAIHWAVKKMRGWEWLGGMLRNEAAWLKKDFEQYYLIAAERGVTWADVPEVLKGTFTRNVYDTALERSFPAEALPGMAETPALEVSA